MNRRNLFFIFVFGMVTVDCDWAHAADSANVTFPTDYNYFVGTADPVAITGNCSVKGASIIIRIMKKGQVYPQSLPARDVATVTDSETGEWAVNASAPPWVANQSYDIYVYRGEANITLQMGKFSAYAEEMP